MSIFSFVKEAGEKLLDWLTPGNANASEQLKEHIKKVGLGNPNIETTVDGDKVTVKGEVSSQVNLADSVGFSLMGGIGGATVAVADRTADGGAEYAAWNLGVKHKLSEKTVVCAKLGYMDSNNATLGGHVSVSDFVNVSAGFGMTEDSPDVLLGISMPLDIKGLKAQ